jgi:fibronectin-binding autotransporter adhesin
VKFYIHTTLPAAGAGPAFSGPTRLETMKKSRSRVARHLVCVSTCLTLLLSALSSKASSHTWAGVGLSGFWSLPANWTGNNPPAAGEAAPVTISFPAGAARLNNTNNVSGLVIDQLSFTGAGYTINGSGTGTNITLRGSGGTVVLNAASTTNTIASSMYLTLSNNVVFTINSAGSLVLDSVAQGTGGLTKQGLGTLTLFANFADTYAGSTYVTAGTLKLFCGSLFSPQVAVPGYLEIGGGVSGATVQLLAGSQVSTTTALQIDNNGLLDLNNFSATCGPLILNFGTVQSGTGTLTLNGDVSGGGGYIYGLLSLGGATRQFSTTNTDIDVHATITGVGSSGIIKNGSGALVLENACSYTGPTIINDGYVIALNPSSFGTGAGGVTVNDGGGVALFSFGGSGLTISNVNLTLNGMGPFGGGALASSGTNTWSGPISLAADSLVGGFQYKTNSVLDLQGTISGPGSLFAGGTNYWNGTCTVVLSGPGDNTFGGAVTLTGPNTLRLNKSGGATAVPGSLNIGDSLDPFFATHAVLSAPNQIANPSLVTILNSGSLDLGNYNETVGGLLFDGGGLTGNSGTLTLGGNVSTTFNGGSVSSPLSLGGQTRTFHLIGSLSVYKQISDGGGNAGLNLIGGASLYLWASNSYAGPTIVGESAGLALYDNNALGSGAQGLLVTNNANLYLVNVQIANKPLTLVSTNSYGALNYDQTNTWSGPVTLGNSTLIASIFDNTEKLTLSGAISGPWALTFDGPGTVTLSGSQDNTYSGVTRVNSGLVRLQKAAGHLAVPGNLIIGDDVSPPQTAQVQLAADNQISPGPVGYVQVKNSGWLNLNAHNQAVPQLYLDDNAVADSGSSGLLTLNGNVSIDQVNGGSPAINGRLSLGGVNRIFTFNPSNLALSLNASISDGGNSAGVTSKGGILHLYASNSFSGSFVADNAYVYAQNALAFGTTNSGVILTNGAYLIAYVSITNEPLTTIGPAACGMFSYGSNVFSGPIQLLADISFSTVSTNYALIASGPISGTANLFPTGPGTVRFSGLAPNTLTGTIISSVNVLELAKTNSTAIYGALQIANGTVRLKASNQILDTSSVSVNTNGVFDLNGFNETIGDFSGSGTVNLGSALFTVGGSNATNTFNGTITGNALCELDKIGGNTLIFSGINTYSGNTFVKGGTLLANGSQPTSDVYISPGATLGGNGTVGNLYDLGGTVSPGNSPGKLNCGYLTLNSGSTFVAELKGTGVGTSYDQLNVTGAITINSGVALNLTKTFAGAVSNQFVIVNNDLADAVTGTFNGLTNGATFTANGTAFRINYNGGSGNDIVLTQLALPPGPQITGVGQSGGSLQISGTALANLQYQVQATTNLTTTNWLNLGAVTANGAGAFQFTDPQAATFSQRFYRLWLP